MKNLIAGNWKMNLTPSQAVLLADGIRSGIENLSDAVDILICPAYVALSSVNARIAGSRIKLGAQNMHYEISGAFTGEISGEMLVAAGCSHVILGHSERRHIFNESSEIINRKLISAYDIGLIPILCVGETLKERELGLTFNIVEHQLKASLNTLSEHNFRKLIIAYEPVWAIGTGKTASPEQAQEVHAFIRQLITNKYGAAGHNTQILYGGSVKPDNCKELLNQKDINGALIGGASLKIDAFIEMIKLGTNC